MRMLNCCAVAIPGATYNVESNLLVRLHASITLRTFLAVERLKRVEFLFVLFSIASNDFSGISSARMRHMTAAESGARLAIVGFQVANLLEQSDIIKS